MRRTACARALSWPWGLATDRRNRAYDEGRAEIQRAAVPVASVGNLSVGGTGKTPLVAALVRQLVAGRVPEPLAGALDACSRPAILSRGYGRRSRGWRLVSEGAGALLDASEGGDEPVLLAGLCPGALVAVCEDRAEGARRLAELGADAILLDDGFQHRRLHRELDLLVWDCGLDPAREALLPFGRLRESPAGALRADRLCYTHPEPAALAARRAWFHELFARADRETPPEWVVASRLTGFVDGTGDALPDPAAPYGVFCGLGNPRPFLATLGERFGRPAKTVLLRDHGTPSARGLAALREMQRAGEVGVWITTGKDAVKLPVGHGLRLAVAGQSVEWRRLSACGSDRTG